MSEEGQLCVCVCVCGCVCVCVLNVGSLTHFRKKMTSIDESLCLFLLTKCGNMFPTERKKQESRTPGKTSTNFESIKLSDNRVGYPLFCLSYTGFWYKHLTQLFYLIHKHSMGYFF